MPGVDENVADELAFGVTCGMLPDSAAVGVAAVLAGGATADNGEAVAVTCVNICGATVYVTLDPVDPEPEVDDSD
jgi:hypothetical protein